MGGVEPQITELSRDLQEILAKLFAILRRSEPHRTNTADLTLPQLSILFTLLDQGPIRMTELAARERVRTPTATMAIHRLEKIGLVKRSRDPSDLRAVLVEITPKGLEQHREALAVRQTQLAIMLSKLTEEECIVIARALRPLARLVEQEQDYPPVIH